MDSKFKIMPNTNTELYLEASEAVKKNEGYCPCVLDKSEDTKCICYAFRHQDYSGECHCGRFIKVEI